MSAITSIMEAAAKAAEDMPIESMNNKQIIALAKDRAGKIVQPLIPPNTTKQQQQQQHMINLQTNALIYTYTAKQIKDGTYKGDDKLSENISACIWKDVEFGIGDKVSTFVGEVRVSPEDFKKHGSNDGTSQLHKIFMCCEVYSKKKGVRVRLANVFFSFGVDRRYADECITRGETFLYMNHLKQQLKDVDGGSEVIVVATDSIRIHLNAVMVQRYEDSLKAIYPNAKLRFIETRGLVDTVFCEVAKMFVPAAARAAQDTQAALEYFGEFSTNRNPDKSTIVSKLDQQTQNDIKARGDVIQKLYKKDGKCELKTHIEKTMNLGEELMNYLSNTKVDIIIEQKPKTTTLLELFRDKWNSLALKEDSVNAAKELAKEFQQFYLDNEALMQEFLQRDDLPGIFDVNYVRTSNAEEKQPPEYQIGINFAAEEKDNNNNTPNITIYDSGKRRTNTGNPGFVALMVLMCTGKVRRTVMLNPARASSIPTENMLMMDLFTLCNKSKDAKQLFSECIGKDARKLVEAEHARQKLLKGVLEIYDQEIRELVDSLVSDMDKMLYKEMSLIYACDVSRITKSLQVQKLT